jgi:hypothetical protein
MWVREVPPLSKALTYFEVGEVDEFVFLVCPTILDNAQ